MRLRRDPLNDGRPMVHQCLRRVLDAKSTHEPVVDKAIERARQGEVITQARAKALLEDCRLSLALLIAIAPVAYAIDHKNLDEGRPLRTDQSTQERT